MQRREAITLLGGAAVTWPLVAGAQQPERLPLIGVIMTLAANDSGSQARFSAFREELQKRGWTDGRNARFDVRWCAANIDRIHRYAAELIALAPDVILAVSSPVVTGLQQVSRTVPIVFVAVADPVAAGFVANLARPGSNATGFILFEFAISAKWLELLKEVAPSVKRAAVLRDPTNPAGIAQLAAILSIAPSLGIELLPIDVRNAGEMERAIATFVQGSNNGLIVPASAFAVVRRELIVALAARYRLPAVYSDPDFAIDGGLIAYGPNVVDQYRQAATYVDRILKGEKPADLPVQAPTRYDLVINLRTAKTLGLEVPATLLARADRVVE
jgi:ABC-type uncharacterized transport system substrate-binding protein